MSVTPAVVAVIAADGRLDDTRIVGIDQMEVDGVAGVNVWTRGRQRAHGSTAIGTVIAIAKVPRDGFPDERPKLLFLHVRR